MSYFKCFISFIKLEKFTRVKYIFIEPFKIDFLEAYVNLYLPSIYNSLFGHIGVYIRYALYTNKNQHRLSYRVF